MVFTKRGSEGSGPACVGLHLTLRRRRWSFEDEAHQQLFEEFSRARLLPSGSALLRSYMADVAGKPDVPSALPSAACSGAYARCLPHRTKLAESGEHKMV